MSGPITPLTPEQFATQEAKAAKEGYLTRLLVAFDQGTNVLTDGMPDETISSRWARGAEQGKWWGKLGSRFLNFFQRDHGAKAQAGDTVRGEDVIAAEQKSDGQ